MNGDAPAPPRVLLCHHPNDQAFADRLIAQLAVLEQAGRITVRTLEQLDLGKDTQEVLAQEVAAAQIALVVLSANFLVAEHIHVHLLPVLRQRRQSGALPCVLILYRPCAWREAPALAGQAVYPPDEVPLSLRPRAQQDQALHDLLPRIAPVLPCAAPRTSGPRRAPAPATAPPALLALLTLVLAGMVGTAVVEGPRLLRGQAVALIVLMLAAFALLTTGVLTGALGVAGVLRSRSAWLGGGAGLFLFTFAALLGGYRMIPPPGEAWVASGRIAGLPPGRSAQLLAGDCHATIDGESGRFTLAIHGLCDRDPLPLVIQVDGYGEQEISLPRAQELRGVSLQWQPRPAEVRQLSGVVVGRDGLTALPGAQVVVEDCAERAVQGTTDPLGRFTVGELPASCRSAPFHLRIFYGDQSITAAANSATGIVVRWR